MSSMMTLGGIRVYCSPLAVHRERIATVERHPIKKRRRAWRVQITHRETPCAYQMPNGVYLHPTLYEQLKAAS